ncbi:MAG: nucleotidyl transferase AbiEii/AbiGii toxin family protein [Candidatus Dormibacteria bacterium]
MTLPDHLREVLAEGTAATWEAIAALLPAKAYLVGGTALAIHLRRRISRDLDFYLEEPVDLDALVRALQLRGAFLPTMREDASPQTLNGVFEATKLQFLEASSQLLLEEPALVAGVRVAGIADLLATKLNVITHRPALRDYVDLMMIEQQGHRFVEEGLALFLEKNRPAVPDQALRLVIECLASFDDVEADPELQFLSARAVTKAAVARYWTERDL